MLLIVDSRDISWKERNRLLFRKYDLGLKISDGSFINELRNYAKVKSFNSKIDFKDLVHDVLIKFIEDKEKLKDHPEIIKWAKKTCKNRFYDLIKKHSNAKEISSVVIDDEGNEIERFKAVSSVLQFDSKDFFSIRKNNQIQSDLVKLSNVEQGRCEILPLSDAIERAHKKDCDLLQVSHKSKTPLCRFMKKIDNNVMFNGEKNIITRSHQPDLHNEAQREKIERIIKFNDFLETDTFNDNERLVIKSMAGGAKPEMTPENIRVITHRAFKKIKKWQQGYEVDFVK